MSDIETLKSSQFTERLLLENNVITENQLSMAKFSSKIDDSLSFADAVSQLGFATEMEILEVISKECGYSKEQVLIQLDNCDWESVKKFNYNLAEPVSESRDQCLFRVDEKKKLISIAIADPLDSSMVFKTEENFQDLGYSCEFFVTTKLALALAKKNVYRSTKDYGDIFLDYVKKSKDLGEGIQDVISMIFEFAALDGTSDIYFNVNKHGKELSHIFFRIDRRKRHKLAMPKEFGIRLAQAMKQLAGMEAGRLTGHQDGSMEIKILGGRYFLNVRVNSITTVSGEHITMRLQMEDRKSLDDLGFKPVHVQAMRDAISNLHGIIVLSGVTGSGKTTTLYSMLSELDPDAFNIVTMEDPVEIRVKNLNQVQINNEAGQSFAETIRASLRQAPDVILLGEVRDIETASRAVEMALTGHLVLTTIHANGISGIEARLEDLGVDNIGAFIKAIELAIHQELVAKPEGGLRLKYEIGYSGLERKESSDE